MLTSNRGIATTADKAGLAMGISEMVTPFFCDACRKWIPHQPDKNLFGDVETEKIVVGGICPACCLEGWDYDAQLRAKHYGKANPNRDDASLTRSTTQEERT